MEQITIEGRQPLSGSIQTMGAKNEVLKLIVAALLCEGDVNITNVPDLEDVRSLVEILEAIGVSVSHEDHKLTINADNLQTTSIPKELASKIRASVVLIGPMLTRHKSITLPQPGGDKIGARPINLFLETVKKFGATVREEEEGGYTITAEQLRGAEIVFPLISVTATEAAMMAATLASGTTTLYNCAVEPEVESLATKLVSAGAKIEGIGTHTIVIHGVESLTQTEEWKTIPDRIEAGTFAMMAAVTRSKLEITDCNPAHMRVPIEILRSFGVHIETRDTAMIVDGTDAAYTAQAVKTHEYPGFSSDFQPQLSILMTQAEGMSMIHETIFEGRLHYLETLKKFGVNVILFDPHRAAILGPTELSGTTVESPDIRAGLAFVLAGLIAEGTTTIQNIYHIKRGAERIVERLEGIGAKIALSKR